ncbi:hypothetical protein CPB86DRAFT_735972 [Serendipita vermifera]|nr:hypothetical protein CPB86DRAFT_735972 [Serendipita vermifera]
MATYRSDKPHEGAENILIGFDIGTTQSAVSFSYVYPGEHPEVRSVVRWPGQPESSGDSKIPTIIAYQNGEAQAFGAEAREYMDDDDYEIALWFKLHLHPESMKISDLPPPYGNLEDVSQIEIPELPQNTTLRQIYSEFIEYLYTMTKKFFTESLPNGQNVWGRLEKSIVMIFCIPNGWDISQQAFIREAVISTGFVSQTDADDRIEFITEGEASVHYALAYTSNMRWLEKNTIFTVIDAGGSTIDSTLYECKSVQPLRLEEVCASECVQAGGVFVDRAARRLLEKKLGDSPFNQDEYLKDMVADFERRAKRLFNGTQTLNVLQFGKARDNDRDHGILKGKLGLTAAEVSKTFDETVTRTVDSCIKLLRGRKVQHHLLVGGFGASPFLRKRLSESFSIDESKIVTVDEPSKKAAAEGSVLYYIKQLVTARSFRFTIGATSGIFYEPSNPLHRSREDLVHEDAAGETRIWTYEPWARKDMALTRDWTVQFRYHSSWENLPKYIEPYSVQVYACDQHIVPNWVKDASGGLEPGLRKLCVIQADFDDMTSALRTAEGSKGTYWYMGFEVVVNFKGTKIQSKLRWKDEKANWKEGPMTILPGVLY